MAAYNSSVSDLKVPKTAAAAAAVANEQAQNEKKLITNTSMCDVGLLKSLRDHMPGLQANQLKDQVSRQFYNPSVMQSTACALDSIFFSTPYDVGSLELNNRIRMYLHNLRASGPETLEGYKLTGDFENAKDLLVIKTARSPKDDTLLHELIVGLFGTNTLREYIPNFAYVYGGFKCSPPLVDPESQKVVTWCLHDENAVNYVLYENLAGDMQFKDYLAKCTGLEFVNAYIQVLYALRLALKLIDFTHYDLQYENVILRDLKRGPFQIAYETEKGVEYVTTTRVPTITDYSFSHIKYKAQHYGRSGSSEYAIFAYHSWIMHDAYKLLMFSMLAAVRNNNRSVMTEAVKIFRFFNHTEDPLVALQEQYSMRYAFPLTTATNALTIDSLTSYIRSVCNVDFIHAQPTAVDVLDCKKMCLTSPAFLTKIGMNPLSALGVPDSIIEFYDITTRLQNQNRQEEKNIIVKAFDYQGHVRGHINKMHALIRDLITLRSQLKLVDLRDMTASQVLDYNTMSIVRSMYIAVAAIIDKTVDLRFYYGIGHAVALSYRDNSAAAIMNDIMSQFQKEVRPALEDAKRVLGSNHDYLNTLQSQAVVLAAVQRDPRLRWYWEGRNLFDVVFGRIDVT